MIPKNYDIKSSKDIDINGKEEDIDYNREILKSCIACRIIASLCYGAHLKKAKIIKTIVIKH